MAKTKKLYFFADGKKVPLVAVTDLVAHGKAESNSLPSDVTFASRKLHETAKSSQSRGRKKAETEYPVYSSKAGGYVVALPEVRVQEQSPNTSESFASWLNRNKDRVVVVGQKRGQTTLRPVSGKGEDAITIANEIYVAIRPMMSQPRFLRLVERPVVSNPEE